MHLRLSLPFLLQRLLPNLIHLQLLLLPILVLLLQRHLPIPVRLRLLRLPIPVRLQLLLPSHRFLEDSIHHSNQENHMVIPTIPPLQRDSTREHLHHL